MNARRVAVAVALALGGLAVSSACAPPAAPLWPVAVQLRIVNATSDVVFIKAVGDESLYPGVDELAGGDSACTTLNAFADRVALEVHSVSDPDVVYGRAWIHPVSGAGWRTVVAVSDVTVARSAACSS